MSQGFTTRWATFGDTSHVLAESPLFERERARLWWVDIPSGEIWARSTAEGGDAQRFDMRSAVGAIAFAAPSEILAAREDGVSLLDATTGVLQTLWTPKFREPGRFNDGRVDRWGRLWLGWLTHARERPGCVFRLGPHGPEVVIDDLIAPNGIGFSPGCTVAYVTDSHVNEIRIYEVSGTNAAPKRCGTLARQARADGIFDGLAVDCAGNIWTALFRGGAIVCFSPDGRELQRLSLPVQQVTSLAFIGNGQMIATSGHRGLSREQMAEEPLAGHLFRLSCEADGLPEHRFAFVDEMRHSR